MATPPDRPARYQRRNRLNALGPYFTMFPLEFPLRALGSARPGDWVLDPFCGRGTTLFAARSRGLPSVGIDTNPVAHALAEAKFVDVKAPDVVRRCAELLGGPAGEVPEGEFWRWCFHPRTLEDLCRVRSGLQGRRDPASITLRALLLGILHGPRTKGHPTYLSNQMPRTYASKPNSAVRFWREHSLAAPEVNVLDAVARRASYALAEMPPRVPGSAYLGDARTVLRRLRRRFTWVITSPPYLGMRTYVPDQWLRAWFLGGPAEVVYEVPEGQIATGTEEDFVAELAAVWNAVAARCLPGAHLVARFGALPSRRCDAADLILASLAASGADWRVKATRSAGTPRRAARQAHQMGARNSPVEELDVMAIFSG